MALVEAGRCDLPIISTDCDAGCREILAPDTPVDKKTQEMEFAQWGILIPVCNSGTESQLELTGEEEVMAEAITKLLTRDDLRKDFGEKARRRSEDFRAERIMAQWESLICQ